jgi:CheY-like chemotaxis protein
VSRSFRTVDGQCDRKQAGPRPHPRRHTVKSRVRDDRRCQVVKKVSIQDLTPGPPGPARQQYRVFRVRDGRIQLESIDVFAPTRTATVLVVEDDGQLREAYRNFLIASGYKVAVAADGLAALRVIDRARPGVLVLDLGLPLVSGWDVYRELQSRPDTSTLPVIIVTGHDLRDIHPGSVTSFLPKPVSPENLAAAVDRVLARP